MRTETPGESEERRRGREEGGRRWWGGAGRRGGRGKRNYILRDTVTVVVSLVSSHAQNNWLRLWVYFSF